MKFLVVGLNHHPEPTGSAVYTSEFCQALAARGHQVQMVCAAPYYPQWQTYAGYRGLRWSRAVELGVAIWRCPIYVPGKVTGLKRILHYISFLLSAAGPVLWCALSQRPDHIITIAPTLMAAPASLLAARLCGSQTLLHIQDFEVEAGFATGQMAAGSKVARIAIGFGDAVIRAHDRVTSISPAMVRRVNGKRAPRVDAYELRNWADIAQVVPQASSPYRDQWAITTPHVALYSGSIARKQGLEMLIETARRLELRRDITFVICGNGPYRAELMATASGLNNIQFHDLQPRANLGALLNLSTVHLLPQKRDAADLVLPSKLTNMLASGRPVVAGAAPGTGLAEEIEGCGIAVEPEDDAAMAAAIVRLIDDPALHARLSRAARIRAEAAWAQEPIITRFLEWLETS